jgi:hypothetical protein
MNMGDRLLRFRGQQVLGEVIVLVQKIVGDVLTVVLFLEVLDEALRFPGERRVMPVSRLSAGTSRVTGPKLWQHRRLTRERVLEHDQAVSVPDAGARFPLTAAIRAPRFVASLVREARDRCPLTGREVIRLEDFLERHGIM